MYACHSVLSNVNLNIETAENKLRCVRPSPSPPNHPSFKKFLLVHPNVFMAMSIQNMMVKHHCGPGCPIIAKRIRMANNQTVLPGIGYNIYMYIHIYVCAPISDEIWRQLHLQTSADCPEKNHSMDWMAPGQHSGTDPRSS